MRNNIEQISGGRGRGMLAKFWSHLQLVLIIIGLCGLLADAVTRLKEDEDCVACLAENSQVCRSLDPLTTTAYCCTEDEIGIESRCSGSDVFCTEEYTSIGMKPFACPYSSDYCGSSTSQLIMHPTKRNFLKLQIENDLYVDGKTCYFEVQVPDADLNREAYRYFWDIEIIEQKNVEIYISNGRSIDSANNTKTANDTVGYRFQYEAESNRVYLAFSANVPATSTKQPAFGAEIYLRSFLDNTSSSSDTTDETAIPVTDVTETDSEEIDNNSDENETFTTLEDYFAKTDSNRPIVFNQKEYVENIVYEDILAPLPEEKVEPPQIIPEEPKRDKQTGLTVFMIVTMLGVMVYNFMAYFHHRESISERKSIVPSAQTGELKMIRRPRNQNFSFSQTMTIDHPFMRQRTRKQAVHDMLASDDDSSEVSSLSQQYGSIIDNSKLDGRNIKKNRHKQKLTSDLIQMTEHKKIPTPMIAKVKNINSSNLVAVKPSKNNTQTSFKPRQAHSQKKQVFELAEEASAYEMVLKDASSILKIDKQVLLSQHLDHSGDDDDKSNGESESNRSNSQMVDDPELFIEKESSVDNIEKISKELQSVTNLKASESQQSDQLRDAYNIDHDSDESSSEDKKEDEKRNSVMPRVSKGLNLEDDSGNDSDEKLNNVASPDQKSLSQPIVSIAEAIATETKEKVEPKKEEPNNPPVAAVANALASLNDNKLEAVVNPLLDGAKAQTESMGQTFTFPGRADNNGLNLQKKDKLASAAATSKGTGFGAKAPIARIVPPISEVVEEEKEEQVEPKEPPKPKEPIEVKGRYSFSIGKPMKK